MREREREREKIYEFFIIISKKMLKALEAVVLHEIYKLLW